MLKVVYSTKTKEATLVTDIPTLRQMGIAFACGIGGVELAKELLGGLVAAADNTTNEEDFQNQMESFFDHMRAEHAPTDAQKEVVNIMEAIVSGIPRQAVIAEHFRQLGQSAFNA